jgi:hypothetical protein
LVGRAPFDPRQIPGCILWQSAEHFATPRGTSIGSWLDASGHEHTLSQSTSSKKPTYQEADPSLHFDGVDDVLYSTDPDLTDLHETENWCLAAWILASDTNNLQAIFGSLQFTANEYEFGIFIRGNTDNNMAAIVRDSGNNVTTLNGDPADGNWHFLLANRKPGLFELWQDGVSKESAAINITETNTDSVNFGVGQGFGSAANFHGLIHSAYAFNRGLTDNEIAMLYNKTKGLVPA